jgi:hypothetical protein
MNLTRPRLAALAGVLGLVVLTGCNAGSSGSASAAADNAAGGSLGDRSAADPKAAAAQAYQAGGSAGQGAVVEQEAVIKKGDISLHTPDPQEVRDRVDQLLTRLHGSLDDEQTVYDTSGRIKESQLVLRVPVATFGGAMDTLEHLGTVVHSSSSGTDVTTQVIDVQQRLRTLRISLRDLNSFQQHAATIDQLLRFENAITQRRAQYQSLKAQRDHLVNQTSMSTIALDVSVPPAHTAPAEHGHHAGFLTGLRHGWTALTDTVLVGLTALGAVLPFALVLAALGLPVWWWTRRHGRAGPAVPAEAGSAE